MLLVIVMTNANDNANAIGKLKSRHRICLQLIDVGSPAASVRLISLIYALV